MRPVLALFALLALACGNAKDAAETGTAGDWDLDLFIDVADCDGSTVDLEVGASSRVVAVEATFWEGDDELGAVDLTERAEGNWAAEFPVGDLGVTCDDWSDLYLVVTGTDSNGNTVETDEDL